MPQSEAHAQQAVEQFKSDVEAQIREHAVGPKAAAAPGAPRIDVARIKGLVQGLDAQIQKLKPVILLATPDAYDALVELVAAAIHGIAGQPQAPAA